MLKKLNTILNLLIFVLIAKDIYDIIVNTRVKPAADKKEAKILDKASFWKNRKYIKIR